MRVLVVDDEYYTRKAIIKMLIDNYHNIQSIKEAENGLQAIELLEEEIPDIVITDVRMPEVDGLKLTEFIHTNNINASIIIISGYADFNYAQKAIRFGVEEYILKPVKKENLFEVMDKIQVKIHAAINQVTKDKIIKDKLLEADRILIENKLFEAVLNENKEVDISLNKLINSEIQPTCYTLFVCLKKDKFNEDEKIKIREVLESNSDDLIYTFFNNFYKNEFIIMLFGKTHKDKYEYNELPKQHYRLKQIFNHFEDDKIVIGGSDTYNSELQLSTAYEEARKAAISHFIFGWNKIYEFNKIKECWSRKKYKLNEELRIFKHLLEDGKLDSAVSNLEKIFHILQVNSDNSMYQLEETFIKITDIINDVHKELFNKENETNSTLNMNKFDISKFCELKDIENYFLEAVRNTCNTILNMKEYNHTDLISEIQAFLQEHYYEDISLEEIAKDKYFMNISYLSRVFKAATGDTFSNALLNIRMEKAKQILIEKDIPITQVASLTGYNNTAYFVKMFKKYFGETPGDFKKKHEK